MSIQDFIKRARLKSVLREREATDPIVRRMREELEATEKRGRQAVEANVHLQTMREAVLRFREAATPIEAKRAEVRAIPDDAITPNGREIRLRELDNELATALTNVIEEYNDAERKFLESYPKPERHFPDLDNEETNRISMLLVQFNELSHAEQRRVLEDAIQRGDRKTLHFLVPLARDAMRSGKLEKGREGVYEEFFATVHVGGQLLKSGPNAWKGIAHEYALQVANEAASRMEWAAEIVASEGTLGLDRLERYQSRTADGKWEGAGILSGDGPRPASEDGVEPGPTSLGEAFPGYEPV